MMEARLRRRLRALGMASYTEYADYLLASAGHRSDQRRVMADSQQERLRLADAITTHKTRFFREPHHFDFLTQRIVPVLAQSFGAGIRRPLRIWSAGCSSGEEPYTLAMVLGEVSLPGFDFRILATDISDEMLERAARAIYTEEDVEPVPARLKRRFLLRSKDRQRRQVKVAPEIAQRVDFRRLNLMERFGFRARMDIIFCRNVLIYFDRRTQEILIGRLCAQLERGGFLVLGHSESIVGMQLDLSQVAPTIYRVPD